MPICTDCNEECSVVEETFDYPGTYCNYGHSGTHRTGVYVSSCCGALYLGRRKITCEEEKFPTE